ncbi:MAG: GNAT family N-acetyltransferase [Dehalococcoidales bacterium]|jgi:RimJ/RimL family protein N-acetyltransferase|nr:GNAT family N-acetyltransferase [Dehalococcoidales bacterium]|tara:strand:+ start:452 stop:1024 length:573 start_codon:yes stop_codon:yes gene_type:complete
MKNRSRSQLKTVKGRVISGSKIRLRDKKLADAPDDYNWQTNPELAQLDAVPRLTITFSQYLSEYASELRNPSPARRLFAVETLDGKHIGNCVYYGVNETKGEAELGIMVGECDYWDKGYGTDAVTTLVSYIFRLTNLNRIFLKTLDDNHRAQKCFEKCDFSPYRHMVRDGFRFVLMEIYRKQWQEKQAET